jgi:hypothetical protein
MIIDAGYISISLSIQAQKIPTVVRPSAPSTHQPTYNLISAAPRQKYTKVDEATGWLRPSHALKSASTTSSTLWTSHLSGSAVTQENLLKIPIASTGGGASNTPGGRWSRSMDSTSVDSSRSSQLPSIHEEAEDDDDDDDEKQDRQGVVNPLARD